MAWKICKDACSPGRDHVASLISLFLVACPGEESLPVSGEAEGIGRFDAAWLLRLLCAPAPDGTTPLRSIEGQCPPGQGAERGTKTIRSLEQRVRGVTASVAIARCMWSSAPDAGPVRRRSRRARAA